MAPQMGLVVEVFMTLVDAQIEEWNLSVHFSLGECGCRMLEYCYMFHRFP